MSNNIPYKNELNQFKLFPGTRYMGSKNKIISNIWEVFSELSFNSFFDAFAGSNVVSYFMKSMGKKVITNDFMRMSFLTAKAIIENSLIKLEEDELDFLIKNSNKENHISKFFEGLYFSDEDNRFIDKIKFNISILNNDYKKSIAMSALIRACIKKRPRGIFTYTGHRYDDGRKDLKKSIKEHFIESVLLYNNSVFNNGKDCKAFNKPVEKLNIQADLVYFDPPYFTPNSDNDYVRRYHFVEGLARNWEGLEIQTNTKTKKFKSYESAFSNKLNTYKAFDNLISYYQNSIIAISYSSNSYPKKDEMLSILKKYKNDVVVHEINHVYSFGNQNKKAQETNRVKEYLFIGK